MTARKDGHFKNHKMKLVTKIRQAIIDFFTRDYCPWNENFYD